MMFVLRKKTRRDALGKSTSFTVRGKEISHQDIVDYFARKGGMPSAKKLDLQNDPPTPTHISYYSPPPSPDLSMSRSMSPFTFMLSPHIPRQPSPPRLLLDSEELFYCINTYFDGSFGNLSFVLDETGNCINGIAGVTKVPELEQLYGSALGANEMIKSHQYVEARRVLSRTCTMLQVLLTDQAEDPRSLEAILQVFLFLRKEGLGQVITILQKFIVGVANTLTVPGQPERMWVRICRMIGGLDASQLEDAIALAWKCANDGFERNLGPLHETTVLCLIDYIVFVNKTDYVSEEMQLRQLLARLSQVYDRYNEMCLTVTSRLAESLSKQQRWVESEDLFLDVVAGARVAGDQVQLMLALQLASEAEYAMCNWVLAERNMREAIVVCKSFSPGHPWMVKAQRKLELWLRNWGREYEAEELKKEIDAFIGRDEIDEELDGV